MEKEERRQLEQRALTNKRLARQANVARAEGFIHTSKGVIFYKDGTGRPNERNKQ